MVVTGIPLACELLRARPEPLLMILIPMLSAHPDWELVQCGWASATRMMGKETSLPSTYGLFSVSTLPPARLHLPPPAHLASVSLKAYVPLAYASPSTWNALSSLGHLFKSKLESAFGK